MYWKEKAYFVLLVFFFLKKERKKKEIKDKVVIHSREYLETGIIYKTKYP